MGWRAERITLFFSWQVVDYTIQISKYNQAPRIVHKIICVDKVLVFKNFSSCIVVHRFCSSARRSSCAWYIRDNTKCATKNLSYPASTVPAGKTGISASSAGLLCPGGLLLADGVTAALLARLLVLGTSLIW